MYPQLKKKIRIAPEIIRDNLCSSKALRTELEGLMTFRVSRFKIISEDLIELVDVGPRKTIHQETYRLINKK